MASSFACARACVGVCVCVCTARMHVHMIPLGRAAYAIHEVGNPKTFTLDLVSRSATLYHDLFCFWGASTTACASALPFPHESAWH